MKLQVAYERAGDPIPIPVRVAPRGLVSRVVHYLTRFDADIERVNDWLYWPTVALMLITITIMFYQIITTKL